MPINIIIGRDEADKLLFGEKGALFLGKQYIKMGQRTSLSNPILLDVIRPHVILVAGKRGGGKSYSLSVIAEEMMRLPEEISRNLSILFFDTMGIFWTMKYPNERQEELLSKWGLKPEATDAKVYVPIGKYEDYKKRGIPADYSFSIKPSELEAADWCDVLGIKITSELGILIDRVIKLLKDSKISFSLNDILKNIKNDKKSDTKIKNAAENRFLAVNEWGLFSDKGFEIKKLAKSGEITIIDISCYTEIVGGWSIKGLVIGLLSKKLLADRINVRKGEELTAIKSIKKFVTEEDKREIPLVWIMVDEAHEFLPREGRTVATDPLIQLLREGRQPGISLVLATQQPGEIHKDVMTQSDIVISHRVTAKPDIDALNNIMQSYLTMDILGHLNNLPRLKGSAIILDDNSERIYPMRVRPKRSWHGGEAPSAIKIKRRIEV